MATSDMDLLEAFDAAFARGQEQRKADARVQFVLDNWRAFASSLRAVEAMRSEMESRGDEVTATALLDALGVPDYVFLATAKLSGVRRLLDRPSTSPLMAKAREQLARHGTVVLFVVSGAHSVVVTSVRPVHVPGLDYQVSVAGEPGDDGDAPDVPVMYILPMRAIHRTLPCVRGQVE